MNETLKKLHAFYTQKKRMPSYREIAELLGYKSKNAAFKIVEKLIETGMVEKDDDGKLMPGPLLRGVPLLGTVEAGFPSAAEEELQDTMSLDDFLIERKEATFILRVKGESMIDAGIMPGDLVIVERGVTPHIGDIVIAEVDHEWTMKTFLKKGNEVVLMPANKNFPPIIANEELKIAAVVKGVVRKYNS